MSRGHLAKSGNVFVVITHNGRLGEVHYWHLVGRSHGCCLMICNAQSGPLQNGSIWLKMSEVARFGNSLQTL